MNFRDFVFLGISVDFGREGGCNLILRYILLLSVVFELSNIPSVCRPAVSKGCELKHLNFLIVVIVYRNTNEVDLRNNLDNHLRIKAH